MLQPDEASFAEFQQTFAAPLRREAMRVLILERCRHHALVTDVKQAKRSQRFALLYPQSQMILPCNPLYVQKLLGSSLSIFLVQPTQSMCIQGGMSNTTSVIMAEATTLALATSVASLINLHNPNYLSDNQELVPFLNNTNFSSPSNWRIKVLTQKFIDCNRETNTTSSRLGGTFTRITRQLSKFTQPCPLFLPHTLYYV